MIFDRTLGRLRPIVEAPLLNSAPLGWRGFSLEQHSHPPTDDFDVIWVKNAVILQQNTFTFERKEAGRYVSRHLLPNQMSLIPAQFSANCRWRETGQCLAVSLDPTFMDVACSGLGRLGHSEIALQDGVDDPFVAGTCHSLQKEVEQGGPSGRLYSEILATSLAVHLAIKYSARKLAPRPAHDRASHRAVRHALEFINDQFDQDISLTAIAGAAGLSPFHFARLFKKSLGISPHQYVIKQRVERAKQLILREDQAMATIAAQVGFFDQSHFSLHFKRLTGLTPREFASRVRQPGGIPVSEGAERELSAVV